MKTGRPPVSPALIARALALVDGGETVEEAARIVGVSPRTVARAVTAKRTVTKVAPARRPPQLASSPVPTPRAVPPDEVEEVDAMKIDVFGDPLTMLRQLFEQHTARMRKLPDDSPRMNPSMDASTRLVKAIAAIEKDAATAYNDQNPEMRDAARRAREKLHELLDRAIEAGR